MRFAITIVLTFLGLTAFSQSKSSNYQSKVRGSTTHGAHSKSSAYSSKIVNTWTEAHRQSSSNYVNQVSIGVERKTASIEITDDLADQATLQVYPNPVHDKLVILNKDHGILSSIQVTNSSGQLVINMDPNQSDLELDFSALEAGVYLLRIQKGSSVFIRRIAKF